VADGVNTASTASLDSSDAPEVPPVVAGRRLRVGVYDLYWSTLGGGEQVDGSIAQVLARHHDVTLLGPHVPDVDATMQRLGVDLSGCDHRTVVDDTEAGDASADFDLFVNGTYLSKAVNRAPIGYYYVHFPGEVPTARDRLRSRVGVVGVKALTLPPRLPQRLREVQAAFDRRVARVEFVPSYTRYLANSRFTASWVERLWGHPGDVLHPPVRPTVRPAEKAPLILVLGRFFDPSYGHSKKQHELLATFRELHRRGAVPGWRLAIVGGCDGKNRDYALAVKRAARGLPVEVHVNATGAVVERLLGEASLYWHGTGLGEDPERHPERFEHFGISVVEAMAAGAVPLVFGAAGPAEIVRDGVDGIHWRTLDQLADATTDLVGDPDRRAALAAAAVERASDFSATRFAERLTALVESDAPRLGQST
jgi:glycosyltransferase involved in cell wall biosynthesis